jgi:hypothetical protein
VDSLPTVINLELPRGTHSSCFNELPELPAYAPDRLSRLWLRCRRFEHQHTLLFALLLPSSPRPDNKNVPYACPPARQPTVTPPHENLPNKLLIYTSLSLSLSQGSNSNSDLFQ